MRSPFLPWVPPRVALALLVGCPVVTPTGDDDASLTPTGQPPTAPTPSLGPTGATTLDPLVLTIEAPATDPDGDLAGYHIEWSVDGNVIEEQADLWVLPAEMTSRDQTWTARIWAYDTEGHEGPAVSAAVTITNAPPTAPGVTITPELPVAGADALLCSVSTLATDPDGDTITYDLHWELEGDPWPFPDAPPESPQPGTTILPGDTVPAEATEPLQAWQCRVFASDGLLAGPVAEVTVYPGAPEGESAPDWTLIDENPNSPTWQSPVSPRDQLEKVSGWYFIHST